MAALQRIICGTDHLGAQALVTACLSLSVAANKPGVGFMDSRSMQELIQCAVTAAVHCNRYGGRQHAGGSPVSQNCLAGQLFMGSMFCDVHAIHLTCFCLLQLRKYQECMADCMLVINTACGCQTARCSFKAHKILS